MQAESAQLPASELPEILEPDFAQETVSKADFLSMQSEIRAFKLKINQLKDQLDWKENVNKALNDQLRYLESIEARYKREQAHKGTDWALLLAFGGVLGWGLALVVMRFFQWI